MTHEVLRRLRGSQSQYKVAEALGIPRSTFNGWESGQRGISVQTAKILADYFGVERTIFFEEKRLKKGQKRLKSKHGTDSAA